jgi:hypothetical protein
MKFKIESSEKRWKGRHNRSQLVRLYVWPEKESFAENFVYRTNRPWRLYRKALPAIFKHFGLSENTGASWSRNAGCSMCPCSPGFILDFMGGYDLCVTISADEEVKNDGTYNPERVKAIKRIAAGGV